MTDIQIIIIPVHTEADGSHVLSIAQELGQHILDALEEYGEEATIDENEIVVECTTPQKKKTGDGELRKLQGFVDNLFGTY